MNGLNCSVTRRRRQDLNRRKVAAISFLANIRVEGEKESDLPGYRCLMGTQVIDTYRRNKCRRKLARRGAGRGNIAKEKKESTIVSSEGSRERTPEVVETSSKKTSEGSSRRGDRGSGSGRSLELGVKGRRQLVYANQWSEDNMLDTGGGGQHTLVRRVNSSQESIMGGQLLGHTEPRVRQMSGNLSEHSHNSSIKEVTFIKADDHSKIAEERLVFISHNKVPFSVTSTIPFNKSHKVASRGGERHLDVGHRRLRHTSGTRPLPAINDSFDAFELLGLDRTELGQEISYSELLEPSYCSHEIQVPLDPDEPAGRGSPRPGRSSPRGGRSSPRSGRGTPVLEEHTWGQAVGTPYSPHKLDGWLGAGKHRTFLPFPSYITSIIEYVRPSDMKKELNEKFSERFPLVQLSLSKLRSIKLEMRRIGMECSVDTVTIAQAYVYFEKLVLRNIINKANRKFCAGASLILAAKLNDFKGEQLKLLIEKTETIFRLNRRDLLASEFAILVALEFSLHIPTQEVFPHYQRLLYQT
eukprot:GFUD01029445.1.p1 GENE.GFUD01029445.1~~GFUD01029445.1.p1  ORF type:complete len:526 (+),score=174.43 GFUD01029445.1:44-1621(+)